MSRSKDQQHRPYRVSFVCTGNICRSPVAAVMAERAVADAGLGELVQVDSAGVMGWHDGERMDPRSDRGLTARGYNGSAHRARKMTAEDLRSIELPIALDAGHLVELRRLAGDDRPERVRLLRSFDPAAPADAEVEDPYYGAEDGFDRVMDEIEGALPGLVAFLRAEIAAR